MISYVRNFVVRILDADRFTIVLFQILDIKSNYLPGIVQCMLMPFDIINFLFPLDVHPPYSSVECQSGGRTKMADDEPETRHVRVITFLNLIYAVCWVVNITEPTTHR
jgi:hypothetical protein